MAPPLSRKELCATYKTLLTKETEGPEALDFVDFGTMHKRLALQNLDQFCHVSIMHEDMTFTSQAWNRSCYGIGYYLYHGFPVGRVKRSMTMRQFIMAPGLYTDEEMNNNLFEFFSDACIRNRPNDYNPAAYCVHITTRNHYDSRHPPSYTTIKNLIHHLVHMLLTLSVAGRRNAKEKVTLEDLFFLHSMDRGALVVVPWNVAKFLSDKTKGAKKKSMIVGAHFIGRIDRFNGLMTSAYMRAVNMGQGTALLNIVKFVKLGIYRYNRLGLGELVADKLDDNKDEATAAEAREAQEEEVGVKRRPNMNFTNRLRAMDDRLGNIDSNIYTLSNEVKDLTAVVVSHHHIDHTRYDATRYSYVPDIPDLGVQQGVNFMASPQDFSTAPTAFTDPFGLFGTPGAGPSTSHHPGNDMDEE
ncbi:transcription factor MYB44-like protein [Tanacetum coccineum]